MSWGIDPMPQLFQPKVVGLRSEHSVDHSTSGQMVGNKSGCFGHSLYRRLLRRIISQARRLLFSDSQSRGICMVYLFHA